MTLMLRRYRPLPSIRIQRMQAFQISNAVYGLGAAPAVECLAGN